MRFVYNYIDPGTGFVFSNILIFLGGLFAAAFGFIVLFFKKIKFFVKEHRGISAGVAGALIVAIAVFLGFFL